VYATVVFIILRLVFFVWFVKEGYYLGFVSVVWLWWFNRLAIYRVRQ